MSQIVSVPQSYGAALSQWRVVLPVYVMVRLIVLAGVAPLLGLILSVVISFSDQSALTDQDIARFLLSVPGLIAGGLVAALFLLGEVFSLAIMTCARASGESQPRHALNAGLSQVLRRFTRLFPYALLLVGRVALILLPFAAVGGAIAWGLLSDYDINYYLSQHPPEFLTALALAVPLLAGLIWVLLSKLSLWAVSLHVVLFEAGTARATFGKSAQIMQGQRRALVVDLVIWAVIRGVGALLIALVFSGLLGLFLPEGGDHNLRRTLLALAGIAALWGLAGLFWAGISLGALSAVLRARYGGATPLATRAERLLHPGLVGGGVALAAILGVFAGLSALDRVTAERDVTVIAHRGGAAARPENTMAAIQHGIEQQADWIEIDVQESVDDQIVVIHDSDFMKLAGNPIKVWDASMADLAQIDIGSWFDPAYSDQRTPLLSDVLTAAKGRSKVLIELKYYGHDKALEQRVVDLVEAAGMSDQVAYMSLKYAGVQKMAALRPDWQGGVLAASAIGDVAGLDGDFLAISAAFASPGLIARAQSAGKEVYVWTVNDTLSMMAMISRGADGLITDKPALAREAIAQHREMGAPARLALWLAQWLRLDLSEVAPQ